MREVGAEHRPKPDAGRGWKLWQRQPEPARLRIPDLIPKEELVGRVKNIVANEGYAFLSVEGRGDFYFRERDLEPGVQLQNLALGDEFLFEVLRPPSVNKAGAAKNLRPHREQDTLPASE